MFTLTFHQHYLSLNAALNDGLQQDLSINNIFIFFFFLGGGGGRLGLGEYLL